MSHSLHPNYQAQHPWESYSAQLMVEYQQCLDEGLDVEPLKPLFETISGLPAEAHRAKLAGDLFDLILDLPQREGYTYLEPNDLASIRVLKQNIKSGKLDVDTSRLPDKIYGAWLGRICGCLLGKTVEGIQTDELHAVLKSSGNWPMYRYIRSQDIPASARANMRFDFTDRCFADQVECMPADDDTNYTALAQRIVDRYGRNFTSENVAATWLDSQPKTAYCTAERVTFCNLVKGFTPPDTAVFQNPYREWIGAQIRGDYFGYINPGDPETAAEMAWRDACISHVKNGIYGEMFIAAAIAAAAVEDDILSILEAGLGEIPRSSRLYHAILQIIELWRNGATQEEVFSKISTEWDERNPHHWCHTISNALIVTSALLWGRGDFGRSICMAVQAGFDTDCNGATVGSILGMRLGKHAIDSAWTEPIHGMLDTSILGGGRMDIAALSQRTMEHMVK